MPRTSVVMWLPPQRPVAASGGSRGERSTSGGPGEGRHTARSIPGRGQGARGRSGPGGLRRRGGARPPRAPLRPAGCSPGHLAEVEQGPGRHRVLLWLGNCSARSANVRWRCCEIGGEAVPGGERRGCLRRVRRGYACFALNSCRGRWLAVRCACARSWAVFGEVEEVALAGLPFGGGDAVNGCLVEGQHAAVEVHLAAQGIGSSSRRRRRLWRSGTRRLRCRWPVRPRRPWAPNADGGSPAVRAPWP